MIHRPTVHVEQGPYEFCSAFASAAALFYFLGCDASLYWMINNIPGLSQTSGVPLSHAARAIVDTGGVPWDACPGYGDMSDAYNAVQPKRAELTGLVVSATRTEMIYNSSPGSDNHMPLDIQRILAVLDAGYPILASGPLQGLYSLDGTKSTRLNADGKTDSHTVCILPEYGRRADGVYVRYINSFGGKWGDTGTGWGLLCDRWYQMHAVYGPLYRWEDDQVSDVMTFSNRRDGDKMLSKNFAVREFAAVGVDEIKVCQATIDALQCIRDRVGKPIDVSSGYRPSERTTSQHYKGRAADFRVRGYTHADTRELIRWIEAEIAPPGLGLYDYVGKYKDGFIHIDYRPASEIPTGSISRWYQTDPNNTDTYVALMGKTITAGYLDGLQPVATTRPTVRRGSKGDAVRDLQTVLTAKGFACGKADGIFGAATETALKAFQRSRGLTADGICGPRTWLAIDI